MRIRPPMKSDAEATQAGCLAPGERLCRPRHTQGRPIVDATAPSMHRGATLASSVRPFPDPFGGAAGGRGAPPRSRREEPAMSERKVHVTPRIEDALRA